MTQRNLSAPTGAQVTPTPAEQLNERFAAIYARHQPRIARLVAREVRLGALDLAEDLTADTFFRAWLDLHKCRATTDAQMYGWLATIARRTVTEHYRWKKNTSEVPTDTGHWRFTNRELAPAGAYTVPVRPGASDSDMNEALRRVRAEAVAR
ncbi:RNA polymerase sigma factor [Streptomyces sp. NPDC002520]